MSGMAGIIIHRQSFALASVYGGSFCFKRTSGLQGIVFFYNIGSYKLILWNFCDNWSIFYQV